VVAHDDGLTLSIDGIGMVVNAPGPTGEAHTPFNVFAPSAGDYTFTLDYAECCGAPAVLEWDINQQIVGQAPEPGSIVMFGTGLLGVASTLRRKLRK
jgi:hypothetical protein